MAKYPHTPMLICFLGAGGTGKTTLLKEMEKRIVANGLTVQTFPSIVREYYAANNVATEGDYLKLPLGSRTTFQMGLYSFYLDRLEHMVSNCDKDFLLCDRSVFDHYAYAMYATKENFTKEYQKFLDIGAMRFVALEPQVLYLPYPTPWDDQAADGFRARDHGKDTIIDALMFRSVHRFLHDERLAFNEIPINTVSERVSHIMSVI